MTAGARFSGASAQRFWVLADQGIVSVGNFGMLIIAGRVLAPEDFGRLSLVFGAMVFFTLLHSGLIAYPLTIQAAEGKGGGVWRRALSVTLPLAIIAGVLTGVGSVAIQLGPIGWVASVAITLSLIQETSRRSLTGRLRSDQAVLGDAVTYLGRLGVLGLLFLVDGVDLFALFVVWSASSLAGLLIQVWQLANRETSNTQATDFLRGYWLRGRWVFLTNTLTIFTAQAFPWALALSKGPEAAATISALATVVSLAHPIMASTSTHVITAIAHRVRGAVGSIYRFAWREAMPGGALLAAYFGVLLIVPGAALSAFFGTGSPYSNLEWPLRVFVVAYVLIFVGQVNTAALQGSGSTRKSLWAQAAASAVAILLGIPLTLVFGLPGALGGIMLVNVTRLTVLSTKLAGTVDESDGNRMGAGVP